MFSIRTSLKIVSFGKELKHYCDVWDHGFIFSKSDMNNREQFLIQQDKG